jgi:hypothetical protein
MRACRNLSAIPRLCQYQVSLALLSGLESMPRPLAALQDALRQAIAIRRGFCSWHIDHASWVVTGY